MSYGSTPIIAASTAAVAQSYRVYVGGVIVVVDRDTFLRLANGLREKGALVIHGTIGMFSKSHVYLLPYNGVVFVVNTKDPLFISVDIEAERLVLGPISL